MLLSGDGDDDFVEVPKVAAARPLALQAAGVIPPELQGPAPHRLVGDGDAALQKHLLHQAKAQGKAEIQPHRMGDDRRWEPMALVADGRQGHARPPTPLAAMPELT
jgi:hypothetical protein